MSDIIDSKTYFLHIPKTGGNWLRSVLWDSGIKSIKTNTVSKHATYDLLCGENSKKIFPQKVSWHIKFFCVVRHPLLWYQSWFKYQHSKGWRDWGENGNFRHWHCLSPLNMPIQDDFNEFMRIVNRNTPGFLTHLYHSYILPSGAKFLKNENLREELLLLNKDWSLGLNEEVIKYQNALNVSSKSQIYWDEKVLKETLENESALLKKYGYSEKSETIVNIN
ncbi:hypothetical protein N8761_00375 [Alphaproteobacteria bacterium]|jgi:hypothetical protein|nr:hypothetical protein [Alphaproteobacteria bacterium]